MLSDLRLEKFTHEDRGLFEQVVFDAEAMAMNYGRTFTAEESDMLFRAMLGQNAEEGEPGFFKVFIGGEFAGMGTLTYNGDTRTAEIEYMLLPGFWGRGYGTALAAELVRMAESSGLVSHITAVTDPENIRSQRILQKLGFELAERYINIDCEPVFLYQKRV